MIAKVSSKGQIVLPKAVRDKLDIKAGSYIRFEQTPDGFKVVKGDSILSLKGRYKRQAEETGISVDNAVRIAREAIAHERSER